MERNGNHSAGPPARVLVVDDDAYICEDLCGILRDAGHAAEAANEGQQALDVLRAATVDLILLDLVLHRSRLSGMDVLRLVATDHADIPVVVITGEGTIRTAVEATKLGAYDFLEKPVSKERILLTVRNALEKVHLQRDRDRLLEKAHEPYPIVGSSASMKDLRRIIERASRIESKVLITGESGAGKEIVAHAVHRMSERSAGPFVAVNCAALPEELIESELFGYEKGAFTGADRSHQGKFEQASEGTLFLDEIGDMSPNTQAKILRVLDSESVTPLGSKGPREIDVRLIAATNKDLRAAVQAGTFRNDLYWRLNVIHIHVPPLRERPDDIPALVDHFLLYFWQEDGLPLKQISSEARALMVAHDWPGNIRELRNVVERLIVLSDGETITTRDVSEAIRAPLPQAPGRPFGQPRAARLGSLQDALSEYERSYVLQALIANDWKRQQTADALEINRTYLWRKMQQYGIEEPDGSSKAPHS